MKNILIVGGSSGLGLELAKKNHLLGKNVFITGRTNPEIDYLKFYPLSIKSSTEDVISQIDDLLTKTGNIDELIYAAGFNQESHIDNLSDEQILEIVNIGITAPAIFAQRLKSKFKNPIDIIFITSSSQYTPRELEPMYTTTKAGMGMLGASLSLDDGIGKVLVTAVSGMKTAFWRNIDKDISSFLDPEWVAQQIMNLSDAEFKYRFVKILRNPNKVDIVESRK
ncbi:MAG: SDR family oxidoreductase [Bacteroidota bacterium]